MNRLLEPGGSEPDFTRGTLEGDIAPSRHHLLPPAVRLPTAMLRSYVAEGEVLPVATRSFGGIGVFAIPEMGRFYRHVLVAEALPAPRRGGLRPLRQGACSRSSSSSASQDIAYNQPKSLPYPTENPVGVIPKHQRARLAAMQVVPFFE